MTTSRRATRGARRKPVNTYTAPDHDPLSDFRLRPLVERYASLAGASLDEVGPHLFELRVAAEDVQLFEGRERVVVAFAVSALDHAPDAEMAVIGSPFVDQLLAAIRARGARLSLGMVTPRAAADAAAPPPLGVPVRNGTAGKPAVRVARHPVGRLLARVLVRAGASVEEHLVESSFFDLATGAPLPRDVAESCAAVERETLAPAPTPNGVPTAELAPARPAGQLVELMLADLRARLAPRVEQLRADAERALAAELSRIDKYYAAMLDGVGAKQSDGVAMAEAGRAIEAEHARRRLEEERRHHVRAVVHPLQIVEMEMLVQRAEWTLSAPKGRRATLAASRFLGGSGSWSLSCPTCAAEPAGLVVCEGGGLACDACAHECSVCGEGFPAGDGTTRCHVDGAPACAEHARSCSSCGRQHCAAHEGDCAAGAHRACAGCLAPCDQCGRAVCVGHATASAEEAPRGSRRLCPECVVHCEGRRSEPVGRDEAAECATCERLVCEKHQATCDADGRVHCSEHLARADQSRRLLCEQHRSSCAHEPDSIYGADEVTACPVCARPACPAHLAHCSNCGRRVCVGEWEPKTSRCATCRQLAPYPAPSAAELAAAAEAGDGRAPEPGKWRAARDKTHLVVEMSQGWRQRIVFAVRQGESRAALVVAHTARGARRTR